MADKELSSSGHKLGQLVGDWYEQHFVLPLLQKVADHLKVYLDHRFRKRTAREGDKIIWLDEDGNGVDYDFVMELDGSDTVRAPAWLRIGVSAERNRATEKREAAVFPVKDFRTGCCGEVRVGFSSQPVLGKRLSVRHFPEQSNKNVERKRSWAEGDKRNADWIYHSFSYHAGYITRMAARTSARRRSL
jgi:hypothetical protein